MEQTSCGMCPPLCKVREGEQEPLFWFVRLPGWESKKQTENKHNPKAANKSVTPWDGYCWVRHLSHGLLEPGIKFLAEETGMEARGESMNFSSGGAGASITWCGDSFGVNLVTFQWLKNKNSQRIVDAVFVNHFPLQSTDIY